MTAAKTLAWALGKPLVGVDHVHAHLYSVRLETAAVPPMPAVGLVCSGGHTALYRLGDFLDVEMIGSTLDDAVGEAYDKVAAILGLGYPGGPAIDRLAGEGNPKAVRFPRSRMSRQSLDFSFSGLKTSVLYHVRGYQGREHEAAEINGMRKSAMWQPLFKRRAWMCWWRKSSERRAESGRAASSSAAGCRPTAGLRAAMAKFPLPVFFPTVAVLHGQCCDDRRPGGRSARGGANKLTGSGCDSSQSIQPCNELNILRHCHHGRSTDRRECSAGC